MTEENRSYFQCLKYGEELLREAGIEEAATDAWLLFSEVFQMSRARYFMDQNRRCSQKEWEQYKSWLSLRAERIPLQHITGRAPFMEYEFLVNEQVLIPRADTEVLVEQAFAAVKQIFQSGRPDCEPGDPVHGIRGEGKQNFSLRILDMCTGSGCIAVSLACMAREAGIPCEITAVDLSEQALAVAEKNNRILCGGSVQLIQSNLFESLSDIPEFDIIVSNPPYIRSEEIDHLMPEVREHEPRMALDGKEDGLYFYRKLAEGGKNFLKRGGKLLLEIGYDQGKAVPEILENSGYVQCRVIKDLAGLDRVVSASRL